MSVTTSSQREVNFAAAVLGLVYSSIRSFYLETYGSRWQYLWWTSVTTCFVAMVIPITLVVAVFPNLTLLLLSRWGTETLVGTIVAGLILQFILRDNDRLRSWAENGKERYEFLGRFGGPIALSLFLYAVFIGPILAFVRLAEAASSNAF